MRTKSKPKSPFYLSLLLRYEGMDTSVLIFTKPGVSMKSTATNSFGNWKIGRIRG